MNKHLKFDIEHIDILSEETDSQFATAEIQAFSTGKTLHDTTCSLETLRKTASTINEVPIIFEIDSRFGDFGTHNDGITIPAGFVVSGSTKFKQLPDGRTALNVLAKIWRKYSGDFIKIFKQDRTTRKSVSVEMDVYETNESNGITELLDFAYQAVCVLGDLVTPANPGSNITMLSFATKEKKEYEKAYNLEFGKYDDLDLSVPETVKSNVQKGLDLFKTYNRGGNSVGLAAGRHILRSNKVDPDKIKYIYKYLDNHKHTEKDNETFSDSYIAWMLHGGDEGYQWSKELFDKISEIDDKRSSYFGIKKEQMGLDNPEKEAMSMEDEEKDKKVEEMAEKPKEETPEEEKKETPEEEKKETEEEQKKEEEKGTEKKMSLDANLDLAVLLKMLEDETEGYKGIVEQEYAKEEGQKDFAKICEAMYCKMCKMAAEKEEMCGRMAKMESDNKTYMEENMALKQFKADQEQKEFQFAIMSTLKDIDESVEMPKADKDSLIEESKKYTLDTIDGWKNLARAKAFEFAKKGKKEDDGTKRYGLPWETLGLKPKEESVWKNL
jgi:hypothetical protein